MKIKIEQINLENIDYRTLKPFQGDLKDLSKTNYKKLKKSFEEKNMFAPTFVWRKSEDEIFILDGHGRDRLLKKEKAVFLDRQGKETYEIPCVVIDAKNQKDAKEKLLLITSQFQKITADGLEAFAVDLDDSWVTETTNFDAFSFFDEPLESSVEVEGEDSVPSLECEPVSKIGDVFILGEHRLMCGDSTDKNHVKTLMNDDKASFVFTDPPYNIDYDFNENGMVKTGKRKARFGKIKNDAMSDQEFQGFISSVFENMKESMLDGSSYYISGGRESTMTFNKVLTEKDFHIQSWLVWVKENFNISRVDYHPKHEIITYGWKKGAAHQWNSDRSQVDVLHFSRKEDGQTVHPTQKPVSLIEYFILNSSKVDQVVLDLFGGSGSTLIACEKSGRKGRVMEFDPVYCDTIIKRWEEFTGLQAYKVD